MNNLENRKNIKSVSKFNGVSIIQLKKCNIYVKN